MVFKEVEKRLIFLGKNHHQKPLLEIQETYSEEAAQLASELGWETDSRQPGVWHKRSPLLWLYHDGGVDAEKLLGELRMSKVPCEVKAGCNNLALRTKRRIYPWPQFSTAKIIRVIRRTAEQQTQCSVAA